MFQKMRRGLMSLVALAGIALGGGAIAAAATSSNSASTSTTSQPGTSTSGPRGPQGFNGPAHGTAAHEDQENPVTGTAADKAKAAAVKVTGGGTAGAVTTDFTGDGYEVTVTKSDGTSVEIHLDSAFQTMQGPRGHRGTPPGAPFGAAPSSYGPPASAGYGE